MRIIIVTLHCVEFIKSDTESFTETSIVDFTGFTATNSARQHRHTRDGIAAMGYFRTR